MKLALAPCLGSLITEHRSAIPESLSTLTEQPVLHRRTHNRGSTFWPQRARALAATRKEYISLPTNGAFADAPGEEFSGPSRGVRILDPGPAEMLASDRLYRLPASTFRSKSTMPRSF